jgi:hypothetical protein
MATVKIEGPSLMDQLQAIPEAFRGEATRKGVTAAAKIFQEGIERNAPVGPRLPRKRPHFPIAQNVAMKEVRDPDIIYKAAADMATTFIVGPTKKAFQAWFIEKGWHAMGRSGRRGRTATKRTHSQRGTSGGNFIAGIHFVERVGISYRDQALAAMTAVYQQTLEAFNRKRGVNG